MKNTDEQDLILEEAKKGTNIIVQAGAGCGKSTTAVLVAEELEKETLYIAYNKAIAVEAGEKFGFSAVCKTMHSLAWNSIVKGTKYNKKLKRFLNYSSLKELLEDEGLSIAITPDILEHLGLFCSSELTLKEYQDTIDNIFLKKDFKIVWTILTDTKKLSPINHDIYLKLFQLSKPDLEYELIILDEAQDINPVMWDIISHQLDLNTQLIVIGDPFQSIYAWRGAVDTFKKVDKEKYNFKTFKLSTSFRNTPQIASLANKVINCLENETNFKLEGGNLDTSTDIETKAVLVRTNVDLISELLKFRDKGEKTKVLGDLKELYSRLYSTAALRAGNTNKVYNKFVKSFKTWKSFSEAAEHDSDVSKLISISAVYPNIHELIEALKDTVVSNSTNLVATGHKAKGLEWDQVTLSPGFVPDEYASMEKEELLQFLKDDQNGNLLYVAVTRARKRVLGNEVHNFMQLLTLPEDERS